MTIKTRLVEENQILDQSYRAQIISEIEEPENRSRKDIMQKRYDCFKDRTIDYVLDHLRKEFDNDIAEEIKNRTPNISILRKIIEKKAMVYKDGVERIVEFEGDEPSEKDQENQSRIDEFSKILKLTQNMKKTNKYVELFKNGLVSAMPYEDKDTGKWSVKLRVLRPQDVDVIEDAENPEEARVYILNRYSASKQSHNVNRHAAPGKAGVRGEDQVIFSTNEAQFYRGDQKDQGIADSPNDTGDNGRTYVWWSSNYHFTTNDKGEIIQGEKMGDLDNPIGELPIENFSSDQDGSFWAIGGDDLVDGAILINVMLGDLYYIAKHQGMGTFYLFGKGVPKNIKVGPTDAVTMEMKPDDPKPEIGYASASPPIDSWLKMVEQFVALLLSTNNLEPSSISGNLTVNNASSGIQDMVKKSENTDDIEDQQETYRCSEPNLIRKAAKFHNILIGKNLLNFRQAKIGEINTELEVLTKFKSPSPFLTEKDKLEIIKMRRDSGLDTMIDSLMRDNPDLSKKQAERKLKEILEDRIKNGMRQMVDEFNNSQGTDQNQEDEDDDNDIE